MAHGRLLGLDIGTSRIKALLIDENGHSIRVSAAETPFGLSAGGTEMSAGALLAAAREAITGLGDLTGVQGVGIASLGESGTFVRDDGPADLPVIAWHDPRGAGTARRLVEVFGDDALVAWTGRPARPVSTIAKIGWLAGSGADLSGVFVGVAGLLNWYLTGEFAQERSLAATSGAYDPIAGRYLPQVFEAVGLGGVRFAPVSPAGTVHGKIHADGAHWSGLPAGIPVTLAGHDHPVGAVGAGAGVGRVTDSMGSGEPLLIALPREVSIDGLRADLATVGGDTTVTAWPAADAPAVLWEQIRPGLGLARLAALLGHERGDLERAAASVGPQTPWSATRLRHLERPGDGDEELFARLAAAGAADDPGPTWAAVLDGYAELTSAAERALRTHSGTTEPTLVIGGGMRSARWMAAKQARSTHGLLLVDEAEATARGAALLAGVAAGVWAGQGDFPRPAGQLLPGAR